MLPQNTVPKKVHVNNIYRNTKYILSIWQDKTTRRQYTVEQHNFKHLLHLKLDFSKDLTRLNSQMTSMG